MEIYVVRWANYRALSLASIRQTLLGFLASAVLLGCCCGELKAQVASKAVPILGQQSSHTKPESSSWPPNSLSREMRRWEALLDRKYPGLLRVEMTARELIKQLNSLGLPIVIDTSAKDDELYDDELIQFHPGLANSSLRARLLQALADKNATISFGEHYISVISLDDAEDSKWLVTIVYDVTQLNTSTIDLIDAIENTVYTDTWQDTGSGLGTIGILPVHSRKLLAVTQDYRVHRETQRLLSGFHHLGGVGASHGRQQVSSKDGLTNSAVGNRAVVVPVERTQFHEDRSNRDLRGFQNRRNLQNLLRTQGPGGVHNGGVFNVIE